MSCPGHIQIYRQRPRSFRELPLRLAEFGACHRSEPSGALLGLMRTQAFTQDDAHVFCAVEQVEHEVARFCALLGSVYADFGFDDVSVAFSTRPELRAGSDALWDQAEALLAKAAQTAGLQPHLQPGEGAFYGPKLEFVLHDASGRAWQCGTVQLDLVLPERFDLRYGDSRDEAVRPVMIHHAVLGSLERFIAILLEHHAGRLPLWLAPDQVVVAAIGEAQNGYAETVLARFADAGLRAVDDLRGISLSKKIVDARKAGIPVLAAVGAREHAEETVSLRWRDGGQEVLPIARAAEGLVQQALPGQPT